MTDIQALRRRCSRLERYSWERILHNYLCEFPDEIRFKIESNDLLKDFLKSVSNIADITFLYNHPFDQLLRSGQTRPFVSCRCMTTNGLSTFFRPWRSGGVAYPPLRNALAIRTSFDPVPPPPNGHAIGSEEVVPSASELPYPGGGLGAAAAQQRRRCSTAHARLSWLCVYCERHKRFTC